MQEITPIPFLDLPPNQRAHGVVTLPGSKSISNRALLLAALAEGETLLEGVLDSDDTQVMIAALQILGVALVHDKSRHQVRMKGIGVQIRTQGFPARSADIFLGNAGTAFRPLTAVLAFAQGTYRLHGVPRMHERPIRDLVGALNQAGAHIQYEGQEGYPPLAIYPAVGKWQSKIVVPGNVSSQFLTALLLAAPLLTAQQSLTIEVAGELISQPYIAITLELMQRFGVVVINDDWKTFTVPAHTFYQSPSQFFIEGDASSASYFLAMGLLGQGPITLEGLGKNSIQGDIAFAHWLCSLGASLEWTDRSVTIQAPQLQKIPAFTLDAIAIPDAAMTAAVLALFADGPCTIYNIASWRVKETDRIEAMQNELRKLGATVSSTNDSITIHPLDRNDWRSAAIATYDDHRMAMCFSLASLSGHAVRILEPDCVAKTFPAYFKVFSQIATTSTSASAYVPVITIDGPTASGKGTLAEHLADRLGWNVLDSGALYRLTALACQQNNKVITDETAVAQIAKTLNVVFKQQKIWLDGADVTQAIRAEAIGNMASQIAAYPTVRMALLERQRLFQESPGLVADGRDMGTIVFPSAFLKIFVQAQAEVRACRRVTQLQQKGVAADYEAILADLRARDARDQSRSVAPLAPAADAFLLDTSALTIEQSVQQILSWYNKKVMLPSL